MNKDNLKGFAKNHPILFHLLLIVVTFLVLAYATLAMIDVFTGHGEFKTMPNVKGLQLEEAMKVLGKSGFKCEVTDSAYSDTYKPGAIIEQEPKANAKVKPLRTVYLTMNAKYPRVVMLPQIVDMSYRQGISMLEGMGFKDVKVVTVSSPYKELILGVKVNGAEMEAGTRLPLSSKIEITIGNGLEEAESDSVMDVMDELDAFLQESASETEFETE